ncbi:unnamed protein product [Somion occarium]|uniref:Protein kinase domain-containing protein n=1 Tax=Somion occarium TaxID=3059160 RepID=A0ABP1CEM1_9APHY
MSRKVLWRAVSSPFKSKKIGIDGETRTDDTDKIEVIIREALEARDGRALNSHNPNDISNDPSTGATENDSALLQLREDRAQYAIDCMDKVRSSLFFHLSSHSLTAAKLHDDDAYWIAFTEGTSLKSNNRRDLRPLLVKLCQRSNRYPAAFQIRTTNVNRTKRCGGAFSDVFNGSIMIDRRKMNVALKRVRWPSELGRRQLESLQKKFILEALIWSKLHHDNIVPLLGIDERQFQNLPCIVLPWYEFGSLCTYWEHYSGEVTTKRSYSWMCDVASGLAYLHEEGVIHGDVRGDNILIHNNGRAHLTDFGLAVYMHENSHSFNSNRAGAVRFLAPEQLDPEVYGFTSSRPTVNSDVFSFAFTCIEAFTGEKPFPSLDKNTARSHILAGGRPTLPLSPVSKELMREDIWRLVCECWLEIYHSQGHERPRMVDVTSSLRELV